MSNFWRNKKVLITGGAGFVGSHVVELLLKKEPTVKITVADNLQNGSLKNLSEVKSKPRFSPKMKPLRPWKGGVSLGGSASFLPASSRKGTLSQRDFTSSPVEGRGFRRGEIKFLKTDLRILKNCLTASSNQEVILNLAARVGGIEYNRLHSGTMFYDNIQISANMLDAARQCGAERFLLVSSACVYPRSCSIPTPEDEGFKDIPEPTNEGYGWAKRMAEFQARAYHQEFGMKIAIARPYNTYGPRDHFNPTFSHVIPALIKRIFNEENPLVVWGDGEQTRAFLYVEDHARGLLELIEKYPFSDPINLGTNEEIKIKNLVELLVKLSGKNPKILFDSSKPAGQPRRNCDTKKAKEKIGFEAKITLEEGLKRTISWYKENILCQN